MSREQGIILGANPPATDEALGVWAFDPSPRPSACVYYRVEVPIRGLYDLGLAQSVIEKGIGNKEFVIQTLFNSDIALLYAHGDDSDTGIPSAIHSVRAGHDNNGKIIVPPAMVYDIDDNIDYIHPFNPAFVRMGVRAGDGSLLRAAEGHDPGDNITTILPDGREMMVWQDLMTYDAEGTVFSIKRNRDTLRSCHTVARMAHGVTVPSPMLAKYYREVHKCKRVYVFPNTVVEEDYWFPNLAPRTDGTVRILWQGGQSHMGDWWPLRDALREVAMKYPQARFVIWGTRYPWIHDAIPDGQVAYEPWVDYAGYKIKRGAMDIDINLAPLSNNVFNRCKSAIKWYEGSIGPRPEATLASNTHPYSEEMVDGQTGLLFSTPEEFAQKLGTLIENADLRRRLAEGAREWVRTNRSPKATIPGLYEFYEELRAARRMEFLGAK